MEIKEEFSKELEKQYSILIKAEERREAKRTFVIFVIVSVTLLTCLINLLFAIKSYRDVIESTPVSTTTYTYYEILSTNFINGNNLSITNINPSSDTISKKFEITNEGDTEITFNIKLTSIKTSLLTTNNLVYTLTRENNTSSSKILPLKETTILSEIKINPQETITYTLNVTYNGSYTENNDYYEANIAIESASGLNLLNK